MCGHLLAWISNMSKELIHIGERCRRCVTCHGTTTSSHIFEECTACWFTCARTLESTQATALALVKNRCGSWSCVIFSSIGMINCLLNWWHWPLFLELNEWFWFINLQTILEALWIARGRKFVRSVLSGSERGHRNLLWFDKWIEMSKDSAWRLLWILFFKLLQVV